MRYGRRSKTEQIVKASGSLCIEATSGIEQNPIGVLAELEEMLDKVLQELVYVRMKGFGQSEEEAKKFYDSDVYYSSQCTSGDDEPTQTKQKCRKRKRKTAIKRKAPQPQVTRLV